MPPESDWIALSWNCQWIKALFRNGPLMKSFGILRIITLQPNPIMFYFFLWTTGNYRGKALPERKEGKFEGERNDLVFLSSIFAKKKKSLVFLTEVSMKWKQPSGGKFRRRRAWELGYDGSLSTRQVWKTLLSRAMKAWAKLWVVRSGSQQLDGAGDVSHCYSQSNLC